MIALLIAFGYNAAMRRQWTAFAERAGIEPSNRVVVDNAGGDFGDVAGSNSHFEFSGYLEGIEAVRATGVACDRLVIFNDTLLSHHWAWAWARLVARRSPATGIWGDGRHESFDQDRRELDFLASWHFDIVGTTALDSFEAALRSVIADFDTSIEDCAYKVHIRQYLNSRFSGGYSNPESVADSDGLARKMACIRAEHRLSAHEACVGQIRHLSGIGYQSVRLADRFLSARRRAKVLLRRPTS